MIYRKLDSNGDYSMGHGNADWLVNSPACVAQAITTRLKLFEGEWYINIQDGLPLSKILGFGNLLQCDYAIKSTIENTPGFQDFVSYTSYYNAQTRQFMPTALVQTIYGTVPYIGAFNV